mmetsp:Transcript_53715/g.121161  ORF Transcript_53715/g.121161 Transcript_53715/m.121161 type:complete len:90 (+) Transcript_53715:297-566(+)
MSSCTSMPCSVLEHAEMGPNFGYASPNEHCARRMFFSGPGIASLSPGIMSRMRFSKLVVKEGQTRSETQLIHSIVKFPDDVADATLLAN